MNSLPDGASNTMNERIQQLAQLSERRLGAHARLHGLHALQGPHGTAQAQDRATAAMRVLHDLAAHPATAEQALALLHELQVHQVEIEMLAEALHAAQAGQADSLDGLPVACLSLDHDGCLTQVNQTAERWLGAPREALLTLQVSAFMSPDDAATLGHRQRQVRAGQEAGSWPMTVLTDGAAPRAVLATLNTAASARGLVLVWMAQPTA